MSKRELVEVGGGCGGEKDLSEKREQHRLKHQGQETQLSEETERLSE